jgi:hypothetical protein
VVEEVDDFGDEEQLARARAATVTAPAVTRLLRMIELGDILLLVGW